MFKIILLLAAVIFINEHTSAQKLPDKQKESLSIPKSIKIDGKADEWNNNFQAYNHATDLFYTIANDSENLYLSFHTDDPDALLKITTVGLNVSLSPHSKIDEKDVVNITYPYFEGTDRPYITFKQDIKSMDSKTSDSLARARNKKLEFSSKYIGVTGVKGVDSIISVYNEVGVKVGQSFDAKGFYTSEIIIPLKYLNLSNTTSLTYHVSLPGVDIRKDFGYTRTRNAQGQMVVTVAGGDGLPSSSHFAAITAKTDFQGEYTLAKAP